jgi:hypothetical protein
MNLRSTCPSARSSPRASRETARATLPRALGSPAMDGEGLGGTADDEVRSIEVSNMSLSPFADEPLIRKEGTREPRDGRLGWAEAWLDTALCGATSVGPPASRSSFTLKLLSESLTRAPPRSSARRAAGRGFLPPDDRPSFEPDDRSGFSSLEIVGAEIHGQFSAKAAHRASMTKELA